MLHQLSEQLLYAVKMENSFDIIVKELKNVPLTQLISENGSDDLKKVFWVNIYNAFFQILRKHQNVPKSTIYKSKLITIARERFSLDDIEHGILRRYRYKYSLGYFPNVFTRKIIKILAVSKLDYRIHFALNCGAKSCPPIAFYTPKKIEEQLQLAELSFIESETTIDHNKKEIRTNMILKWFLADFGGKKGIRKIIGGVLKQSVKKYAVNFNSYSWEEQLDNYK